MGDVLVFENVTSDGIEPPLSDLESEVLPLHHEAVTSMDARAASSSPLSHERPCSLMDKALAP